MPLHVSAWLVLTLSICGPISILMAWHVIPFHHRSSILYTILLGRKNVGPFFAAGPVKRLMLRRLARASHKRLISLLSRFCHRSHSPCYNRMRISENSHAGRFRNWMPLPTMLLRWLLKDMAVCRSAGCMWFEVAPPQRGMCEGWKKDLRSSHSHG